MRLAILVVYLFRPERRELFRLHLSKIRENTRVPYRIFGSIGHLPPELAEEVAAEPDIEALRLPVGVLPNSREEHADLLERLNREALKGDYTHFCTLHIDSFPVSPDWVSSIVERLDAGCAMSVLAPHGYSACLFWPRSLYEEHRFDLLVPQAERDSEAFERFREAHRGYDMVETGLGFIYGAWKRGLRWHELRPSHGQQVYDGRVFHLVAGTRYTVRDYIPVRYLRMIEAARPAVGLLRRVAPKRVWRVGRNLLADEAQVSRDGTPAEKREQLDLLLADPEGFLRRLGVEPTAASRAE